MRVSELLHNAARVGSGKPVVRIPEVPDRMTFVDAGNVDVSFLGHDYYRRQPRCSGTSTGCCTGCRLDRVSACNTTTIRGGSHCEQATDLETTTCWPGSCMQSSANSGMAALGQHCLGYGTYCLER
ncbi:hypothetical protein [Pseudarthrobacter siccitolerans]